MGGETLQHLSEEICRIFLGWKLREDFDALLALREGELRIDLRSGETRCDGDPLPPLFIAGELRTWLESQLEREELADVEVREARLMAVFSAHTRRRNGRDLPALSMACRASITTPDGVFEAEANNAG